MEIDYTTLVEQQKLFINKVLMQDKLRIPLLLCSGEIRAKKKEYLTHVSKKSEEEEFIYLSKVTDEIDRNYWYRFWNKRLHNFYDFIFERKYHNNKLRIKKELQQKQEMNLSIVCIIKNEARYIREWVAYYKIMGVDHIYLFNNGSTDDIHAVLKKEIESEFVTLIRFDGANAQLPVYRLAVKYLKGRCRWLAFIDADEFVLPTDCSLKEYLEKKEKYSAIGINWVVFGTGGHVQRPEGLVIQNYLHTFEDEDNLLNLRIKCIVNPAEVYDVSSPHFCVLKKGKYAVDEDGEEITTKWMYVSGSGAAFTGRNKKKHIRINHYWTKSEQDLREKCNRGYAAGGFNPDYENIMRRLDYPQKIDTAIEKYIPLLQQILME